MKTKALLLVAIAGFFCVGCGQSQPVGDAQTSDAGLVTSKITEEELILGCARLHSCNVQKTARLVDCVDDFFNRNILFGQRELYQSIFRCVNASGGDCTAIRQCVGFGKQSEKCDRNYVGTCTGDIAKNCDLLADEVQSLDCAKGGLKCAVRESEGRKVALCGLGSCDPKTYKTTCRNDQLIQCNGGALEVTDCGEAQLQCRDPQIGACEGTGRSCVQFAPECDKDTVVKCERGYMARVDCSKMYGNKTCDLTLATCKAKGTACSIDAAFNKCEGDTLVYCFDGFEQRLDCRKLGFFGCEQETNTAHCKAPK